MLACDSQRHLSGPQEAFSSHFRTYPFKGEPIDVDAYDKMFTEEETKEKIRKLSSSPSTVVHSSSPSHSQPSSMADGSEVPAHQPEVLPPASAAQTSMTETPSPRASPASPPQTSGAASNIFNSQPASPKVSHHMMQLLQQQSHNHHHHHYHPQQQQQSPTQQQQRQQQQQQQRHHYNEAEMEFQQEKRTNSDSDSSGTYPGGDTDADGYNTNKRYREFVPDTQKDEYYWEKRRKNNEAARKSREKRRMHDMVLEGRISTLENDNGRLRCELLALKKRFNLPQESSFGMDDNNTESSKDHGRLKMSPPPTAPSHHSIRNAPSPNMAAKAPHGRSMPHSNSYASPPPLLAVAGAMQMGIAVYPSAGPGGLPYFFPEASKMSRDGGAMPTPLPGLHGSQQSVIPRHPSYPMDAVKQEPYDDEFRGFRERSNSNVERRTSSYPIDMPDIPVSRRGSVGNYVQYCPAPVSPPISTHQTHPTSMVSRAKLTAPFLSRHNPYEGSYHQGSWSQRSPSSSHSSDENYDEPLQLTVNRRDSNISNISSTSNNVYDDNSRESDQGVTPSDKHPSNSPPASSFPLKLRHKLPSHDVYSKDLFPSMGTAALAPNQPSSFSSHHFINGLAHLSDMALSQNNPLSLIKKETTPCRQRKDSSFRSGSRRNPLDQKYLDPKYLERRRRNNEAARKCRENRKTLTKLREAKSDYLESENSKLRDELNGLQEEMKQLRELIEKKRLEQGIPEEFPNDS